MPKKGQKLDYPASRATLSTPHGRAIYAALVGARQTLTDLARALGVHPTTAGRWLYGARPSRAIATRIAERYGQYGATLEAMGYE
jgi:transcriptional regulator with XRE-family HTH domain